MQWVTQAHPLLPFSFYLTHVQQWNWLSNPAGSEVIWHSVKEMTLSKVATSESTSVWCNDLNLGWLDRRLVSINRSANWWSLPMLSSPLSSFFARMITQAELSMSRHECCLCCCCCCCSHSWMQSLFLSFVHTFAVHSIPRHCCRRSCSTVILFYLRFDWFTFTPVAAAALLPPVSTAAFPPLSSLFCCCKLTCHLSFCFCHLCF